MFFSVIKCSCKDQDNLQIFHFTLTTAIFLKLLLQRWNQHFFSTQNEQEGQGALFTYLRGIPAVFLYDHQQTMRTRCLSQPSVEGKKSLNI